MMKKSKRGGDSGNVLGKNSKGMINSPRLGVNGFNSVITQTDANGVVRNYGDDGEEETPGWCRLLVELCCCICVPSIQEGTPAKTWGNEKFLLPPQNGKYKGKKCLVLDLDETLVHSSFKPIANADIIIQVDIEGTSHDVYVTKRPHVDTFLRRLGEIYEIIIYTASLAKYADPLLDTLDKDIGVIQGRLFREACVGFQGNYVKDLSRLDRDLSQTIIVDNAPASYLFQPGNAIGVTSFIDDLQDAELAYCCNFLERIVGVQDVTKVLPEYQQFIQDARSRPM